MNKKQEIGSYTAKGGFLNENHIVSKFADYKNDREAMVWLQLMGYDYKKISKLNAAKIPPRINEESAMSLGVKKSKLQESLTFKKADIQIKLEIKINNIYYIENLSLKKANKGAGYNQVDKRPVDKYRDFWNIPDAVCKTLKLFTGEIMPLRGIKLKDERRMYLNEIEKNKVEELVKYFSDNKTLIVNDVIRGRGGLAADWFLVTRKDNNTVDWILKDINFVCNYFAKGSVIVTDRGNLKIGRISLQRKGGTPDPKSLQFKINPLDLFDSII